MNNQHISCLEVSRSPAVRIDHTFGYRKWGGLSDVVKKATLVLADGDSQAADLAGAIHQRCPHRTVTLDAGASKAILVNDRNRTVWRIEPVLD